jgi:superfamily II DNA or RNA helicase
MEVYEKEIIKRNLRGISIAQLCQIAGNDVVEMLDVRGVPITNSKIIDIIIDTKGFGIFNNSDILNHFVNLAQLPNIRSWTSNNACKTFLDSYGLSHEFLRSPQSRRELSFESIPEFILHNYQDDIKKQTSKFLLSSKKKLMIQLPTGAGKTSMTIESIIDFFRLSQKENTSVLWMAHTDELCEQAIEAFNRAWLGKGTFKINLVRLWGGNASEYRPNQGPSFIVTSFQSAYSMIRTQNNDVFDTYNHIRGITDLVVVDEAHMSLAPTYKSAIDLFSNINSKLLGLTATPGRHGVDGDNQETINLAEYYENNIINMNHFCGDQTPVQYLQSHGVLSKVTVNKLVTDYQLDLTQAEQIRLRETGYLSDNVLKRVGDDANRNNIIFEQIKNVAKIQNKKTLVFASSVGNSNTLAAMLTQEGVKAKSVTGETFSNDRRQAVQDFSDGNLEVLINFNIFSTGFDDPTIDCVIIARPTFSVVLYSQMVGRGLRGPRNGGTENCLLINVIDNIVNLPDIENACNFFDREWEN